MVPPSAREWKGWIWISKEDPEKTKFVGEGTSEVVEKNIMEGKRERRTRGL